MSGGEALFEVEPAAVTGPKAAPPVPVKKMFRAFVPDQMLLLPPSLDEWLPEEHLARFIAELVDEVLDLGPVLVSYTEKRGHQSIPPGRTAAGGPHRTRSTPSRTGSEATDSTTSPRTAGQPITKPRRLVQFRPTPPVRPA